MQWAPTTNLTFGTSGGAWIVNFSTTEGKDKNALIAVTSFQFTDYPGGEGCRLSDRRGVQSAAR